MSRRRAGEEREASKATDPRRKRRWRRPFHGVRRFWNSCRNNGSCPWCGRSRMHKHKRSIETLEGPQ